jgi:hypothetical protein
MTASRSSRCARRSADGLRLDVGAQLPRRRQRLIVRRLRGVEARLRRLEVGSREQVARRQVLRALELLLRVGHLRRRADDGGTCRAAAAPRRPTRRSARAPGRASRAALGAVLQLLGVELDERRAGGDAIAEIVDEPRDAPATSALTTTSPLAASVPTTSTWRRTSRTCAVRS